MINRENHSKENNQENKEVHRPKILSKEGLKLVGVVIYQAIKDLFNDNAPQWAAAISYFTLLSAFPLMLALSSIGSYFVDQEWVISQGTAVLSGFLPEGAEDIEAILTESIEARGGISIVTVIFLLWSGSRVFGVVTRALNIAYDVDENYGFFKRTLIELLMLLSIGLLFVAALVSRVIMGSILSNSDISPEDQGILFRIGIEIIPVLLLFLTFFLVYYFVPRRRVHWKAALVGTIFFTTAFAVGRPAFWYYINSFAEYELVYGSIAILVILVFWAWLVSLFLLIGGELAGHVQDILIEGKPVEEVEMAHVARSPIRAVDGFQEKVKKKIDDVNGYIQGDERGASGSNRSNRETGLQEETKQDDHKKKASTHSREKYARTEMRIDRPSQPASASLPITPIILAAMVGFVLFLLGLRRT
jgi:membrane protein